MGEPSGPTGDSGALAGRFGSGQGAVAPDATAVPREALPATGLDGGDGSEGLAHPKAPGVLWLAPMGYAALLEASVALSVVLVVADSAATPSLLAVAGLLALGAFAFAMANVGQVIGLNIARSPWLADYARKVALAMKLGLVPFFLGGGLLMAFLMVLALHPVLAVGGSLLALSYAVAGWLLMLPGSMWGITAAAALWRGRRIGGVECALHIGLQLLFVADVVDAVVLFVRGRRGAGAGRS